MPVRWCEGRKDEERGSGAVAVFVAVVVVVAVSVVGCSRTGRDEDKRTTLGSKGADHHIGLEGGKEGLHVAVCAGWVTDVVVVYVQER